MEISNFCNTNEADDGSNVPRALCYSPADLCSDVQLVRTLDGPDPDRVSDYQPEHVVSRFRELMYLACFSLSSTAAAAPAGPAPTAFGKQGECDVAWSSGTRKVPLSHNNATMCIVCLHRERGWSIVPSGRLLSFLRSLEGSSAASSSEEHRNGH